MSSLPSQKFANPGLPGFARFGEPRFTHSEVLAETEPSPPRAAVWQENFPAGKFSTVSVTDPDFVSLNWKSMRSLFSKTFLQESFCQGGLPGHFESEVNAHRGGQLMPTTQ